MNIKKAHVVLFGVTLVVALSLISLSRTNAQVASRSAGPSKVAVCDLVQVFGDYQRAKDLTTTLNERKGSLEAENKRRVKKLEDLKMTMEGFIVGSKQHTKVLDDFKRQMVEREVWLKVEQASVLGDHRRLTEEMFKQIKSTIATVAKERNIDLVLQLESGEMNARNVEELVAQIDRRKVLFNTPEVDITAAVLQRINESYRIKK